MAQPKAGTDGGLPRVDRPSAPPPPEGTREHTSGESRNRGIEFPFAKEGSLRFVPMARRCVYDTPVATGRSYLRRLEA